MSKKYADQFEYWLSLYNAGKSLREISRMVGVDNTTIARYFRDYGVELKPNFDRFYDEWNDLQKSISLREIARRYGTTVSTVSYVLRKGGATTRTNRVYQINEDYFKNLDKRRAYWLGLIAADGNVYISKTNGHTLSIKLHRDDDNLLTIFSKDIGLERPLYYRDNHCEVKVSSKVMCEDLIALGIKPRKSVNIEFPKIPDELKKDFILGYFDGDGSITYQKGDSGSSGFYITGNKELLHPIQELIVTELGLARTKLNPSNTTDGLYNLTYRGRRQVLRIMDWLYRDCPIYMQRKYERYTTMKEDCGAITDIQFIDLQNIFDVYTSYVNGGGVLNTSQISTVNRLIDGLSSAERDLFISRYPILENL